MKRKYDSSRRLASAAHTRQTIVETAVKLHGQGITSLSVLAAEAGVSLPTVNKHFPTREALFGACTRHVAESLDHPLPETLAAIADPAERLHKVVWHVFALHEATLGQMWTGYKLADESPVLAVALAEYEQLINSLVDVLAGDQDPIVPPRNARILASRIPTARLEVVRGAGHLLLIDRADHCAAVIAGFLERS